MKKPLNYCTRILFILSCITFLLSGCRSADDDSGVSVAAIQITPSSTSLNAGQVVQLSAAKLYTNSTTVDCSSEATWTSSKPVVASFSAATNGLLSALAAGTTKIIATCGGVSKSYVMTVLGVASLASLEVSPIDKTIVNNTKLAIKATGVYSDGSVRDLTNLANWTSDNSNVFVERSIGSDSIQVNADGAGTATVAIGASYAGKSDSTIIEVSGAESISSIIITPVNPTMAVGDRLIARAVALFTDNTVQEVTDFAAWSSGAPTAAAVSNVDRGAIDALAAGTATITASEATTDTITVTVDAAKTLDSIEVYPPTQSMILNSSLKFYAIGIYSDNTTVDLTNQVTWTVSDSDLLSVDNTSLNGGRATAVDEGSVYLSASLSGSTVAASAVISISDLTLSSIEVTPKDPTFPANLDLDFEATGVFSDGSTQDLTESVVWSSSAAGFLKINNASHIRGQARSLAAGTATVTATFEAVSGTSEVTVSGATLNSVEITPSSSDLPDGYKQVLTATGVYLNGATYSTFNLTPYIAWKSDNTAVVVDNIDPWQGVATATNSGVMGIMVTASFKGLDGQEGAVSGTETINTTAAILSAIEIAPANPSCVAGINTRFTATGIFSDSTTLDMTPFVVWKSSDLAVSTANNAPGVQGQFQCKQAGTATVTASSGSTAGTTTLTVY